MAQPNKSFVALDIGTSKVSVVIAEQGADKEIRITGVGTSPSKGLRKGVVINIESTVAAIQEGLKQAESMSGSKVRKGIASISGSHLEGINSHGVVAVKHREVNSEDIDRVIEAAKAVVIPMDREILHVLPQEFIIDNQDGIREPLGISGVRLESKVHVITGSTSCSQNILKCAQRSGLEMKGIVAASLASAKAVLSPEEMELGVCLIDIGGGTADVAVFHLGAVKFTTVIPLGGNHITNDIAAGLRTPLAAAEEIKILCGAAKITGFERAETIEVPSTGGRAPRVLSRQLLSEIIEPRVIEIFSMIHRSLSEAQADIYLASGVVLTGGCANLKGITDVAEQLFNLPVRIGAPRSVSGLSDVVKGPEFSTAVGILLQDDIASRGGSLRIPSAPSLKRVANWFREHF